MWALLVSLPPSRSPGQLRSPQLRAALASLGGALQTDNINSVFANFGLNPADGSEEMARGDGPGAFLAAIQARADSTRAEREAKAKADGDAGGSGGGEGDADGAGGDDAEMS